LRAAAQLLQWGDVEIALEILKSRAHVVAGLVVLWTVIGLVSGLGLAGVALFAAGKLGAWRLAWKHGVWLRVLNALWMAGAFAALGSMIGCCEGSLRGIETAVRESQFRTELLQRAGEAGAFGIAWTDVFLENLEAKRDGPLSEEQSKRVDAFARGDAELDVRAFLARLDRCDAVLVEKGVDEAKRQVRKRVALPESRLADWLIEAALAHLVRKAVRDKAGGALAEQGVDVAGLLAGLPAVAKASGHPDTIAAKELADHIVERALIPGILTPTRKYFRGTQLTYGLAMAGALALSVVAFWIGRVIERSRARKADATAPPVAR
jgi:hypothetical protein